MSLTKLLVGIGVAWVVLGSLVLGPSLLIYPAAWMTIMAFFFGLHQVVGTKVSAAEFVQETSPEPQAVAVASPTPSPVATTPTPAFQTAE
ncbi:MAG: hypothetical protein COA78_32275 [Blastopirellula sp.]|nr:MAG: hypothetical protein COA78_32275 [Blastopirellula sp.]